MFIFFVDQLIQGIFNYTKVRIQICKRLYYSTIYSCCIEYSLSFVLAGKRVRPKGFYYAYAPRQLKRSCRLGHSIFREAKTPKRVEEFFDFPKFWISDKRSCVISNEVFGALFKLLAPSSTHCIAVVNIWP